MEARMRPLHTDERFGVAIALLVALWVGFYFATPAALWFTVRNLDVHDAARWQDVTVDLDRTIHRDFTGEWLAKVRRKEPQGWVTYATTPRTRLRYQDDSQLPIPITLEWLLWTEPRAYELPCGTYDLTITWTVNAASMMFKRDLERSSEFKIWGDECIE
jgi:hypothetical protein